VFPCWFLMHQPLALLRCSILHPTSLLSLVSSSPYKSGQLVGENSFAPLGQVNLIIYLLLPKPPSLTGRIAENTTCAPDPFNVAPRGIESLLTVLSCLVALSLDAMWNSKSGWQLLGLTRLSSLLGTS